MRQVCESDMGLPVVGYPLSDMSLPVSDRGYPTTGKPVS